VQNFLLLFIVLEVLILHFHQLIASLILTVQTVRMILMILALYLFPLLDAQVSVRTQIALS